MVIKEEVIMTMRMRMKMRTKVKRRMEEGSQVEIILKELINSPQENPIHRVDVNHKAIEEINNRTMMMKVIMMKIWQQISQVIIVV
jgi:hypothetical protein